MLFIPMLAFNGVIIFLCYRFLPTDELCHDDFHEKEASELACMGNTVQMWLYVALAMLVLNSGYLFLSAACGASFFVSEGPSQYGGDTDNTESPQIILTHCAPPNRKVGFIV